MAPAAAPTPQTPLSGLANKQQEVGMSVQQYLDGWHQKCAASSVAMAWDRKTALGLAVDALDVSGGSFPGGFKEEVMRLDDEEMASKLIEALGPMAETLPEVTDEVCEVLGLSSRLRGAIEEADSLPPGTVGQLILENDDTPVCQNVLRRSVVMAAKQAAKIRKTHTTWRKNTEARIDRLARAEEDAERACQQLLVVESQLEEFGASSKSKAKGALVGLADKNDKVTLHTSFVNWSAWMTKARSQRVIHNKYQAQLDAAEKQLFSYKEAKLRSVKAVFERQALEGRDALLAISMDAFKKEAAEAKFERQVNASMDEARKRMADMQESQKESAKKVMMSMSSGSEHGVMQGAWNAWRQVMEDAEKEKGMAGEIKAAQEQFKKLMASKKEEAKSVMAKMQGATEEGLVRVCIGGWAEVTRDEKIARESQKLVDASLKKFKFMKERQSENAQGVQERVNNNMDATLLMTCLIKWHLLAKCTTVDQYFTRKMESKRKQLNGVQNLFKAFAAQLEQGLADGDTASQASSRGPYSGRVPVASKKSRPDHGRSGAAGGGMQRGAEGTVSLPSIHNHSHHRHA